VKELLQSDSICKSYHSLLRQMAAQKQEKQSSKNEKYTQLQIKN